MVVSCLGGKLPNYEFACFDNKLLLNWNILGIFLQQNILKWWVLN